MTQSYPLIINVIDFNQMLTVMCGRKLALQFLLPGRDGSKLIGRSLNLHKYSGFLWT